MRIPGRTTLRRLARPIAATLRPGGLILGYHRIASTSWDPLGLCIHPSHFRQHLEILIKLYSPVPLSFLIANLCQGKSVRNMVALTFDDAYQDFFENAKPTLDQLGVPATIFVATGYIGRSYWWDEVVDRLRPDKATTPKLELFWDKAGKARRYAGLTSRRRAARAAQEICRQLGTRSEPDRAAVMEQIRGVRGGAEKLPRVMAENQILELAESPGVEIACHSVSHPMLASLDVRAQREEIENGRRHLEAITGVESVAGFSYPNGSYSELTRQLVAKLGYDYACASQPGVVRHGQHLYSLPRIWAPDVGRRRFQCWLSSWRGARRMPRSS